MTITSSVSGYSLLDDCSDYTTWNGESPATVTDFYITGTSCVGFTVRGDGANDIYVDTGTYDLSGSPCHVRFWMMTTALKELLSEASDGIQFYCTDGSNTAYWTIGGSDTYPGGWWNLVVDVSQSPTSGTKPTDMSVCTSFGIRFNHTGTAKNSQNTWIDHFFIGDGIVIYGDDGGGSFDLDDVLAEDISTSNGWGIIRKIGGVFYATGSFTFGDGSGTGSCDFADSSQDLVFENRPVSSSLYGITVVGNGTGTTSFVIGAKSGGRGISGCFIHTQSTTQTPKYTVTCTDTDVGTFKVYGTTFIDSGIVSLPASGANREVISCAFEGCAEVVPSTCKVQYCTIVGADDVGVQISSTSHQVSDCNIVQCGHGIEFTAAGDYSLSNVVFAGGDGSSYYDIENSANGSACDSYAESNRDEDITLNDTTTAAGQSFTGDGGVLGHCYFHLSKANSPTGSAYAKLYAHTGTFGTDGTPTGAALATSLAVDVSTLTGTPTLTKFIFDDDNQYTLGSGTKYFIVIEYTSGTSSNTVLVGDDGSSPSHGGNAATYASSTWTDDNTKDVVFYCRTGGIVNVGATGTSNPSQSYVDDTGSPEGTTFIDISFALTVIGLEYQSEVTIVTTSTTTVLHHTEDATVSDGDGKYKIVYTHAGGATVDILVHHVDYQPDVSNVYGLTLPSADSTVKVKMFEDVNYYNPT